MNDLRLYLGFFRGIFGFPSSGTSVIYDFDTPFTIRSGSGFSALDSDTLTVPTTSYGNGILEFSGPISSLSLNTNGASISFQAMTFGVDDAPPPIVPLPAALWFGIAGIGALGQIGRRRAAGCPPFGGTLPPTVSRHGARGGGRTDELAAPSACAGPAAHGTGDARAVSRYAPSEFRRGRTPCPSFEHWPYWAPS